MPFYLNTSESTYERPGDGVVGPWVAEPGRAVECDANPSPAAFAEVSTEDAAAANARLDASESPPDETPPETQPEEPKE